MKFKAGDIVRIKDNACRLSWMASKYMESEQGQIRKVKSVSATCDGISVYNSYSNGNDDCYFIWEEKSLELYNLQREQMLELEKSL